MRMSHPLLSAFAVLSLATTAGCSVDVSAPQGGASPSAARPTLGTDSTRGDQSAADADAGTGETPSPSVSVSPHTETLRFSGTSTTNSADCTGRDVRVDSDLADLTLKGRCKSVTVAGPSNSIVVDSADLVEVTDSNNEVMVKTVGAISVRSVNNSVYWVQAAHGEHPEVANDGKLNEITHITEAEYDQTVSQLQ